MKESYIVNAYNVIIANPAGNITAFVLDNNIEKKDYIYVANKLMEIAELEIEQVGFVKEPKLGGELRLEMMGGEFCGNATRSFGLYLAMLKGELDEITFLKKNPISPPTTIANEFTIVPNILNQSFLISFDNFP